MAVSRRMIILEEQLASCNKRHTIPRSQKDGSFVLAMTQRRTCASFPDSRFGSARSSVSGFGPDFERSLLTPHSAFND